MSNFASGYVKYINHLEQINDAAVSDPAQMIDEVEDAYHDHLENIARNITSHHQGVRVVMLSGPSSSGKTTTAHLLRDYLTQYGAKSYIVSLDDFYRGVGLAPRLPDGEYNYESVEALDVEAIKQCLLDIITTGRFSVPSYNFALGRPTGQPRPYQLGEGDIVIVEGIHGLNPLFTRELPQGSCVKLYVSVKQQIKSANGDVISPMDLRLVRRIVRDVQFGHHPGAHPLHVGPGGGGGGPLHPALPPFRRLHRQFHPHLRALRHAHCGHPLAAGHRRGQPLLPQGPGFRGTPYAV